MLVIGTAVVLLAPIGILLFAKRSEGPSFRFVAGKKPIKVDQAINATGVGGSRLEHVRKVYEYKLRGNFQALAKIIEAEVVPAGFNRIPTPHAGRANWIRRGSRSGGFRTLSSISLIPEYDHWQIFNPRASSPPVPIPKDSFRVGIVEMHSAGVWDKIVTWVDELGE